MDQGVRGLEKIREKQEELSKLHKSESQNKTFELFRVNFEMISIEFKNSIEELKKKNDVLERKHFEDSEER